jgi:hypothetical protein
MTGVTTRLYGALLACALGVTVGGCDLGATAARKVTSAPTKSASPHPSHPLSPGGEVRYVGLRSREIPSSQQVRAPAIGRSLAQATLDQCGARFASEAHRVARRQIWAGVPGSDVLYSSEVVAYDSEASAHQAFQEEIDATGHCTKTSVPVSGAGMATFRILTTVANSSHLPVSTSYTVEETITQAGKVFHVVLVFQQRGDVLDGSYLTTLGAATPTQALLLRKQAIETGHRLAVLPLRTKQT